MTTISQCWLCQHFDREDKRAKRCAAFPNGIPAAVFGNSIDHREPVDGDGGLRFKPRPGVIEGFHPMNRRDLGIRFEPKPIPAEGQAGE